MQEQTRSQPSLLAAGGDEAALVVEPSSIGQGDTNPSSAGGPGPGPGPDPDPGDGPSADPDPQGAGDDGDDDDPLAALALAASEDLVALLPRYATPNIASSLPVYSNNEQEFILRTFAGHNYDMLRHLPSGIREQQVNASRTARQEACRTFLLPGLVGSQLRLKSYPANQQGLFTAFEYIPSRYSLAAELASKERVASEATRLAIGRGKEFMPVVAPNLQKQHEIGPKVGYVYLAGPEEDRETMRQANRSHHEGAYVQAAFVPPGTQKVAAEVPTRLRAVDMMKNLKRVLEADWEGAYISIFENEHDCWVVCFQEHTVDGLDGLAAYMNVFIRTNPVATEYRLTKVVEYWGSTPGDGCVYYVARPPWVAHDKVETFFKLHPEERDYRTSFPVVEMEAERKARKKAVDAGQDELEVDQRLKQLSVRAQHTAPPSNLPTTRPARSR
ncbi:hypothetical protein PLESTB_001113200 [Pleodorina starrii]|uniref:Uncharacterized protein n=1 Tax=Pleodorina starrii TaxID=330485 RepID=A0A9W6BQP7_9CHLO|nr:hypothetical protein PLESTM_001350100 [Pleodorina starrii]GLC56492.1 hypothetical protein PLESTB_001113200 [Pleodorina starrii]GLC65935.1 hypothetical protein PLESTF_000363500 [Pleodorina starrii]